MRVPASSKLPRFAPGFFVLNSQLYAGGQIRLRVTLRLDSAQANHIDNEQFRDALSAWESHQNLDQQRKHPNARECARETARYNCHGMTFGSRRTGIYDADTVKQVLAEDGYQEVAERDALPGDVIVYFATDGDVDHSGIVIDSRPPRIAGIIDLPTIRSKWGNGKEFIHLANDCPYKDCTMRYFRIQ